MNATSQELNGFVGKVTRRQKQTKFGMRPVTSISIGIRNKASNTVSWDYVNIWGTPDIQKGDILSISDVKAFGRAKYGKITDHQICNQRDRTFVVNDLRQLVLPL
ncbi:MAG: hypothetical protein AAFV98_13900 [Chloroflexota bacterium]